MLSLLELEGRTCTATAMRMDEQMVGCALSFQACHDRPAAASPSELAPKSMSSRVLAAPVDTCRLWIMRAPVACARLRSQLSCATQGCCVRMAPLVCTTGVDWQALEGVCTPQRTHPIQSPVPPCGVHSIVENARPQRVPARGMMCICMFSPGPPTPLSRTKSANLRTPSDASMEQQVRGVGQPPHPA